jgi:glycosyltransferase involved in cell wall biosynthesis
MRISFIIESGGRSGGTRCTVIDANGLIGRGHTVRILCQRERLGSVDWLRNRWIGLRYPAGGRSWLAGFKGLLEPFGDVRQCRFEPGEIVIGAGIWGCRQVSRVNQPGIRKVHYLHGEIPWDRPLMKDAWQEQVPKIGVASYLDPLVRELCGQRLYAVVPNGVDANEYYPVLDDESRTAVGTVFGAGRHKDPETVLAVLEKLRSSCPSVPTIVFGASAPAESLASFDYVRLPSVVKARELYSRSLVWFLGSRSEGFGFPILEAMACGCAVVATDCGGPRDIIVDGQNGFLVPVGDIDRMVERIQFLLNDRAARERIVASGRQTAGRFTWEHSVDLLEEALQSIDGGRS